MGTGESLTSFRSGDCILADRGYSTGRGMQYVQVTVRVNSGSLVWRRRTARRWI